MLFIIVRSFSRPIAELAGAAQRIAAGDLDFQVKTNTRTREVQHLTDAFRTMTADLKKRIEELRQATAVRERIAGELAAAHTIQNSILPAKFPLFPDRREIDVHAVVKPAREVGGDFFDVYFVDDEWLCVVIGDVSGKGVPASLFMAVTTTLMRAHTTRGQSPAKILGRVNAELCQRSQTGMFVTIFCAQLNCRTGSLVYCNAGHNAPYVVSQNGALAHLGERGGVALGATENFRYEDSETRLESSDTLFCWTDGVTEAINPTGKFFSEALLPRSLTENASLSASQLTEKIIEEVKRFADGSEQADDITVLALRFFDRKKPAPATSSTSGNHPARATTTPTVLTRQ
jgi:sigma-B regulation protein RsbU (phosphoserine phosphatase)